MPNESFAPITFRVPGQTPPPAAPRAGGDSPDVTRALPGGLPRGRVTQSVHLRAARGTGPEVRVEARPGRDVVVIQIAGGPELVLHPETARDLLLAQGGARARGPLGDQSGGEVSVPLRLQWSGLDEGTAARGTRGSFGDVLVSAVHIVSDVLERPAADLTASEIANLADRQVADRVYALDPRALPP